MITIYVVLDGFDLGVGALHRLVGRSEVEREEAISAIGPTGSAASSRHALTIATYWWPVGIVLALVYFTVAYRLFLRGRRAT
jgi:hypothetical protein